MPRYHYTAQSRGGEQVSDTVEVPSLSVLAASLAADGRELRTIRVVRERVPRVKASFTTMS